MKKSTAVDIEVELMKKDMYEKAGLTYVQAGVENTENPIEEEDDEK